jgi:hypothetical protein
MSLLNRKRYVARWIWDRAKEIDVWPDTNPGDDEGTSVRSALDILRHHGHVPYLWRKHRSLGDHVERAALSPTQSEGIAAYRWVRSVDDALSVLGHPKRDYFAILNSWGRSYPHIVYMPASVVERLLNEHGEAGVVTDK